MDSWRLALEKYGICPFHSSDFSFLISISDVDGFPSSGFFSFFFQFSFAFSALVSHFRLYYTLDVLRSITAPFCFYISFCL